MVVDVRVEKMNGPFIFYTLSVGIVLVVSTDQCLQPKNTDQRLFSDCCRLGWYIRYYLVFLKERNTFITYWL